MFAFEVNDMTCGHCSSTITQALKSADPQAKVSIDLARHRVTVESAQRDSDALGAVIAAAGYSPVAVEVATDQASREATGKSAACCGHCH